MSFENGDRFDVRESLRVRCCAHVIAAGRTVEVRRVTSKNRVIVLDEAQGALHKIKCTTLRRVGREVSA